MTRPSVESVAQWLQRDSGLILSPERAKRLAQPILDTFWPMVEEVDQAIEALVALEQIKHSAITKDVVQSLSEALATLATRLGEKP